MTNLLKAFLFLLATLIIPTSSIASTPQAVVLRPSNTLTLLGVVNEDMVEAVAHKLPTLTSSTVYVQILSPGGSVLAGKRIIDQLVGLQLQGKKVVCVAHIAVSMAFVILQSPACPTRQVVSGAILMQHQASVGVDGPINNLMNNVNAVLRELEELDTMQATRLGMTLQDFRTAINNDLWLNSGTAALRAKAADSQAIVLCSPELIKAKGSQQEINLGRVRLLITASDCPYIVKPKIEVLPISDKKNFIRINY
jgi:ATP-dependent protease ClpP protease subunit